MNMTTEELNACFAEAERTKRRRKVHSYVLRPIYCHDRYHIKYDTYEEFLESGESNELLYIGVPLIHYLFRIGAKDWRVVHTRQLLFTRQGALKIPILDDHGQPKYGEWIHTVYVTSLDRKKWRNLMRQDVSTRNKVLELKDSDF